VFIGASAWGWYQWLRGGVGHAPLAVSRLSARGWAQAGAAWALLFWALAWFLAHHTSTDVPLADGFLTAGSLVGQLLLARKKIENWHTWIVVDVLYEGLYIVKDLKLTALLSAVFVVMAVQGLRQWQRAA
jgi:nicotinamide mononucleotide transporter